MKFIGAIAIIAALTACSGDQLRVVSCSAPEGCSTPDAGSGGAETADAGEPLQDAGTPPATDAGDPALMNIDPVCMDSDAGVVDPPPDSLPLTVPDDCLVGFEMNDFKGTWSISSLTPAGSREIVLEVDIATYVAPDVIRIAGTVGGVERDLLLTCRLQTANYGDPTGGTKRPPADSIREFRVEVPDGTTQLTFDFTGARTPTYIRVLGLCDFDLQHPPPNMGRKWRLVMSR